MGQGKEVRPTSICHQADSCGGELWLIPRGNSGHSPQIVLIGGGVEDMGGGVGGAREKFHPCHSLKTIPGRCKFPGLAGALYLHVANFLSSVASFTTGSIPGQLFLEPISLISKYILGLKQKASSLWWVCNNVRPYSSSYEDASKTWVSEVFWRPETLRHTSSCESAMSNS